MALKTILVHVDHTDATAGRLATATRLAARHDAHLVGLAIKAPVNLPIYAEVPLPSDLVQSLEQRREEDIALATKRFEAAIKESGRAERSEWRVADGDPTDALVLHGLYADLTVIGQPDPDNAPAEFLNLPDNLVVEASGPLLVVPYIGAPKTVGETVVIAWNASRESARAVADAMPLLEKARKVQVLVVDAKKIGDEPGTDIATHLAHHGIKVEVVRAVARDIDIGDALLNHLAGTGADLLVMGAYGHSRLREVVLGGVTRHIIQHMTAPVLMAH